MSEITHKKIIARNHSIRQLRELREEHGPGKWVKMKGNATVRLENGELRYAEVHWYQAHGIGSVRKKIKDFLD